MVCCGLTCSLSLLHTHTHTHAHTNLYTFMHVLRGENHSLICIYLFWLLSFSPLYMFSLLSTLNRSEIRTRVNEKQTNKIMFNISNEISGRGSNRIQPEAVVLDVIPLILDRSINTVIMDSSHIWTPENKSYDQYQT